MRANEDDRLQVVALASSKIIGLYGKENNLWFSIFNTMFLMFSGLKSIFMVAQAHHR